jgi:hypothetical protein
MSPYSARGQRVPFGQAHGSLFLDRVAESGHTISNLEQLEQMADRLLQVESWRELLAPSGNQDV